MHWFFLSYTHICTILIKIIYYRQTIGNFAPEKYAEEKENKQSKK